jgi:cation diffusion facilitator CzcD-associated flavoprotein CzcO
MTSRHVDVVIVGAGFAGLYAAHLLTRQGLTVQGFEAGDGVGGTWFWNRYPGARCDVDSLDYSFSFDEDLQQEWEWTERYSAQPEILRYLNHVADRFDLRRHFRFSTRVAGLAFDEVSDRWTVEGDGSDGSEPVEARFVVMATGALSEPNVPPIAGLDDFEGRIVHTARWPDDVDVAGQRVAVIGTGSTGVQLITTIGPIAEHVLVLQRTPNYSIPAGNRPLSPDEIAAVKGRYAELRTAARHSGNGNMPLQQFGGRKMFDVDDAERERVWAEALAMGGAAAFARSFDDVMVPGPTNDVASERLALHIAEIVDDPEIADRLTPTGFTFGCKRVVIDTGYFETFNRPNVTLVDLRRTPIDHFDATGVVVDGVHHDLDLVALATGFDAVTGAITRIDITGRDGLTMREALADGLRGYLGLAVPGFPNLFTVTGPGSPSVLANVVTGIEQHVEWIAGCIAHLDEGGLLTIEADELAEAQWMGHVAEIAEGTVFTLDSCNSWYLGSNIPGKPRQLVAYIGGLGTYGRELERITEAGYQGFTLR